MDPREQVHVYDCCSLLAECVDNAQLSTHLLEKQIVIPESNCSGIHVFSHAHVWCVCLSVWGIVLITNAFDSYNYSSPYPVWCGGQRE